VQAVCRASIPYLGYTDLEFVSGDRMKAGPRKKDGL
jgi:hypothetical protein